MKVSKTYEVELGRFHDVLLEVFDKSFTDAQLEKLFHLLPEHIKQIAYEWGGGDTVFGDESYVYIKNNKELFFEGK